MLKFLSFWKHYFLDLYHYCFKQKHNSTTNSPANIKTTFKNSVSLTKSNKSPNSLKRDQSTWSKQYNQKLEVKARKHQDYLQNRKKYNELRRQRRQLAKVKQEKANENDKTTK